MRRILAFVGLFVVIIAGIMYKLNVIPHKYYYNSDFGIATYKSQVDKDGDGIEQNMEEAVKWWRLAAEQGDADAQYNLGNAYKRGEGVEQNMEEAVKWWRLAAEKGDEKAKEALKSLQNE